MARRHTSGFDIVGFDSDPTPGDPDLILNQIVPAYTSIGDDAQSAVDALRDNSMQDGKGATMTALRNVIGDSYPPKLQDTADSFHTAAQVYRTYAQSLSDAQNQLDKAMDQASPVASTANTTVPPAPPNATPDQISAAKTQQQNVDQASAQLTAATRLAQDAKNLRDQAGTTFSKSLAEVSTVPARSAFQKFLDFFEHSPLIQILIDVAIAIVTVFFPVVGLALGALALAVTTALNTLATGHFDAGTFLAGLAGLALGGLGAVAKFAPAVGKLLDGGASRLPAVGKLFQKLPGPAPQGILANAKQVGLDFGKGFGINFGLTSATGLASTGVSDAVNHTRFTGAQAAGIFGGAAVAGVLSGAAKGAEGQLFKPDSAGAPPKISVEQPEGEAPVATPATTSDPNTLAPHAADIRPNSVADPQSAPAPDSLGRRAFDQGSATVQHLGTGFANVGIAEGLGDNAKDHDGDTGESLRDAATTAATGIGGGTLGAAGLRSIFKNRPLGG